jgi:Restriction endonuclease
MAAASHASPTAGSGWARPEASEVRAEHRRLLHTGQMDSFDLGRLSDYDFEVVCKDLFEEILGVRLEIFARGRDRGVDLRHMADDKASLVIQCKHWIRSGSRKLITHMRAKEHPKITDLRPDRYILVTSVELSPEAKATLQQDLSPYVQTTGDLWGLNEIAEELRKRPALVRRHFKLWLGSTAVLRDVLHQDIIIRSTDLIEELKEGVRTFVSTPAFGRAWELLEASSVCLLVGIPGIGKTTLAKMLVRSYMNAGYQPVVVSRDVSELDKAWLDGVPQIFFYDDFLGSTALELRFGKNEDSDLIRVMRRIQRTPEKRLVLTTREYILAHAKQRHSKLEDADLEWLTCTIEPDGLTEDARTKILYNHVHYSSISAAEKRRFARPEAWSRIIRHPNFNPRLIEQTLRLASRQGRMPEDVPDEMIRNMDNPVRIWEHVVEEELNDAAVHLLEVLFTFGYTAPVEEVQRAWGMYRRNLGATDDPRQYFRALKTLQGSMVSVQLPETWSYLLDEDGADIRHVLAFHNPSIRDYMAARAARGAILLSQLIDSIDDRRRISHLVSVAADFQAAGLLTRIREHAAAAVKVIISTFEDVETSISDEDESWANNLEDTLEMADVLKSPELAAFVVERFDNGGSELWVSHDSHLASLAAQVDASDLVPEATSRRLVDEMLDAMLMDAPYCGGGDEWPRLAHLNEVLDGLTVPGAAERRTEIRREMAELAVRELQPWRTEDGCRRIHETADDWAWNDLEEKIDFLASIDIPADLMAAYKAAKSAIEAGGSVKRTGEAHAERFNSPSATTVSPTQPMSNEAELLWALLEREED